MLAEAEVVKAVLVVLADKVELVDKVVAVTIKHLPVLIEGSTQEVDMDQLQLELKCVQCIMAHMLGVMLVLEKLLNLETR